MALRTGCSSAPTSAIDHFIKKSVGECVMSGKIYSKTKESVEVTGYTYAEALWILKIVFAMEQTRATKEIVEELRRILT